MFQRLKGEEPRLLGKLTAVAGDLQTPGLGISDSDVGLLSDRVDIVIHCAATVKFTEKLKLAVATNVMGTYQVCLLALKMTKLKVNYKS